MLFTHLIYSISIIFSSPIISHISDSPRYFHSLVPFNIALVTFRDNTQSPSDPMVTTKALRVGLQVRICLANPIYPSDLSDRFGDCEAVRRPLLDLSPSASPGFLLSQAFVPLRNQCVHQQPNHDRWLQCDWVKKGYRVWGRWTWSGHRGYSKKPSLSGWWTRLHKSKEKICDSLNIWDF